MSETPDCPEGTVDEATSTEDLLALLAPGGPATSAPGEPPVGPAGSGLPDGASYFDQPVRQPRRSGPAAAHAWPPNSPGVGAVAPTADLVASGVPGAAGPTRLGYGSGDPVRIGSRFQPLPGTLSTATGQPAGPSGTGLILVAAAGTPVHAVEAGTITHGTQPGELLHLAADGGLTFLYGGLAAGSVPAADGARVAAGTILGTIAAPRLSRTGPAAQPHLLLRILDAAGADLDVADFLVGLPDPNELGHAAVGAGVDVDPDALDQEIVGASAGVPAWEPTP